MEIIDLNDFIEELPGVRIDIVTKNAGRREPLVWKSIEREVVYV